MAASPLAAVKLSRRQALGLAAGGAAGAAGLRLATLHLGGASGSTASAASAAGPAGSWASPLGDQRALAAHLLRRAGFGYSEAELDAAARLAYTDLVDQLVSQRPEQPPALPAAQQANYRAVSQWWYAHMATTTAQFPERMLLFWHGHFTSDYRKAAGLPFVHQQNQLYRRLGTGDLHSLLAAVMYDPLMVRYLDLDKSTAKAPNENFSREVMELYTLGVGHYSEQDVREGARAMSGIRVVLVDSGANPTALPRRSKGETAQQYYQQLQSLIDQGASFQGRLVPRQHDQGSKTYLGRSGNLGPEDVAAILLAQEACAPFVATKALVAFCMPNPPADLVTRVATQFRNSRYDIRTLMRAIFTSDEFRSGANYRSLVRAPADYAVATMRALGQSDLAAQAVTAGAGMDQVLYDPPTVAGWPSNGAWLSSSSMLARVNFAQSVIDRGGSLPDVRQAVHSQLDGVVGPDTAAVLNASPSNSDRWYALLASPEFQLK
jgi:uncharacterized protein (DUF1800 family)